MGLDMKTKKKLSEETPPQDCFDAFTLFRL